ncbi:SET domain-containing protein [Dacryopinax primogenitus]|uniref:Histone-lysine N-methyltransferase SET5 n=1 Tax=Dacryopinax primogenitus (strain DJM 731) TaxID=1858805 RepID=M5FQT9_DACPD|nr:SET domain-containing protein [Dacryopinax primogenitus]EJT99335.1 SET domain-containing protein [Dacryopinax primogenitus]
MSSAVSPPDDALIPVVKTLRASLPTLGAAKLLAVLLTEHPEWTVSEKRFKKLLQTEGLALSGGAVGATNDKKIKNTDTKTNKYPASKLNPHLDITTFSDKIDAVFISPQKGKGLVAKLPIAEGEALWREDPFVHAADWDVFDLQQSGNACQYCALPFIPAPPTLAVSCPAISHGCNAAFCSRLCLTRAQQGGHSLLCRGRNPPSKDLLDFARKEQWRAVIALAVAVAKIMTAFERSDSEGQDMLEAWGTFATLDQEDRAKTLPEWEFTQERHRALWNMDYDHFVTTLCPPETDKAAQTRLRKIVKKTLSEDVRTELFSYRGFLRGLGRVSLNLDSHGGLFLLHSHMNHSCIPNMAVKHPPAAQAQKYPSSRIALVANRDIQPGEELTVTYVNPTWPYRRRKEELKEWGVECDCERCEQEKKDEPEEEEDEEANDLARELRMSFGV